ncbi:helix-loop-helix DNA-binding domain-containing protein [Apodospora peruviana]|uniref:Helix-loop-helix DNA-binding domain-containing protein n=1 Tax=Apodospora peruviana TaxID=516989 RepID=A0AAE0MGC3_9PEZI|nr:helix-loop-helix DNA-binding domain-containing protein [Apodospora peruviana]
MPGTTLNPSMSFDPFTSSFGAAEPIYQDFSPDSLFNSFEDFGTDFNSDSTGSPVSPISPVLSASSFGAADDWMSWENAKSTSRSKPLKTEPLDDSVFTNIPARTLSMSPAINPMDLAMPPNDFDFMSEGISNPLPMFQPPQLKMSSVVPAQPQLPKVEQAAPARRANPPSLKRKSSTSASEDEDLSPPPANRRNPTIKREKGSSQGPKKTAHNMIEKRYRTNLNDKIAQLRDSVPALRVVAQRLDQPCEDGAEDENLDDSVSPAPKLNKATILSKATEYIAQLERRNLGLETENNAIRGRMEGLEMLLMSRGGGNVWN